MTHAPLGPGKGVIVDAGIRRASIPVVAVDRLVTAHSSVTPIDRAVVFIVTGIDMLAPGCRITTIGRTRVLIIAIPRLGETTCLGIATGHRTLVLGIHRIRPPRRILHSTLNGLPTTTRFPVTGYTGVLGASIVVVAIMLRKNASARGGLTGIVRTRVIIVAILRRMRATPAGTLILRTRIPFVLATGAIGQGEMLTTKGPKSRRLGANILRAIISIIGTNSQVFLE